MELPGFDESAKPIFQVELLAGSDRVEIRSFSQQGLIEQLQRIRPVVAEILEERWSIGLLEPGHLKRRFWFPLAAAVIDEPKQQSEPHDACRRLGHLFVEAKTNPKGVLAFCSRCGEMREF